MSNGSEKERIYVQVRGTLDDSWFELPPGLRMVFESQPSEVGVTVLTTFPAVVAGPDALNPRPTRAFSRV